MLPDALIAAIPLTNSVSPTQRGLRARRLEHRPHSMKTVETMLCPPATSSGISSASGAPAVPLRKSEMMMRIADREIRLERLFLACSTIARSSMRGHRRLRRFLPMLSAHIAISTAETASQRYTLAMAGVPTWFWTQLEHHSRVTVSTESMAVTANDVQADYGDQRRLGRLRAGQSLERGRRAWCCRGQPERLAPDDPCAGGRLEVLYSPRSTGTTPPSRPGIAGRRMHWPRGRVLGGWLDRHALDRGPGGLRRLVADGLQGWSFDR
jgi:hypothetical protein